MNTNLIWLLYQSRGITTSSVSPGSCILKILIEILKLKFYSCCVHEKERFGLVFESSKYIWSIWSVCSRLLESIKMKGNISMKHVKFTWQSPRDKCSYSEIFWSVFSRIQTEWWPVKLRIRSINLKLDQLSKNVTKVDMLIKIDSTSSPETYYQGNNIMKQYDILS